VLLVVYHQISLFQCDKLDPLNVIVKETKEESKDSTKVQLPTYV